MVISQTNYAVQRIDFPHHFHMQAALFEALYELNAVHMN